MIKLDRQFFSVPKNQFIAVSGLSLSCMLIAKMLFEDPNMVWLVSATYLLFISVSNNCISLFSDNFKKYFSSSSYAFIFFLIGSIVISMLLSGLSIHQASSFRTIYFVILLAHFIFVGIVVTIKGILGLLESKDQK